MSNTRKTQRKNKTNQVINWPSADDYFTIDSLTLTNKHMLTTGKQSDITLRVRLMKAVKEEPKTVAVIGTLNTGKGRPQLAFAIRPVTQSALDKAKANKIILVGEIQLVPVMEINNIPTASVGLRPGARQDNCCGNSLSLITYSKLNCGHKKETGIPYSRPHNRNT